MKRLSIVVSQSQSANPIKRQLEEDIVTTLLIENGIDVTVIPDLYHLKPDGTAMLALQGVSGDMVVLSWMYERGARWILDKNEICGREGETLLVRDSDESDDEHEQATDGKATDDQISNDPISDGPSPPERVIASRDIPQRKIYVIDLRVSDSAEDYVDEIKRIAAEGATQVVELGSWIQGSPTQSQSERFKNPRNDTSVGAATLGPGLDLTPGVTQIGAHGNGNAFENSNGAGSGDGSTDRSSSATGPNAALRVDESAGRRWYPVIDFSRCTNCMECIDFCLFGVYGIDAVDTILVEQPDNCRKGCPACSRVCPENAIMFPQHKTPAIAGAPVESGALKIDLSRLFGAPDETPDQAAARERDEQLVMAGRDVVGPSNGIPRRQEGKVVEGNDELDDLLDALDDLDL